MADLFDRLSVTDEERATLRRLGASTPIAVLSLRKASKDAFDAQFAPGRAGAISAELMKLLNRDELERLRQPLRRGGRLGARLGGR